jgi:hypothetical protein
MYVRSRGELRGGLGATATKPIMTGTATGASIGSAIVPGIGTVIGAAVGAVIGAAVKLFGAKEHNSPWGFLYDDYPLKIYEAEVLVRQAFGMEMPPMAVRTGGTQYQASMQDIVPRYVPGSEQQIAAYDRRLNEPGGAYEVTYGKQLDLLRQIQSYISQQRAVPQVQIAPTVQTPTPFKSISPPPSTQYYSSAVTPQAAAQRLAPSVMPPTSPFIPLLGIGALLALLS